MTEISLFILTDQIVLNSREKFEPGPGFEPQTSRFVFTCQFDLKISNCLNFNWSVYIADLFT